MKEFSNEQIEFMLKLNLKFDFNNLSSEDWISIEDTVGDMLDYCGLNDDYTTNEIGNMCYSILNMLP